jgi:hypothetical protein
MNGGGEFVIAWQSIPQDGHGWGVFAQRYGSNEAPTTGGIPAVNVQQDAADTVVNLWGAFDDTTDPDDLLTFSITANTNPPLFSSTGVGNAAGTLTLDFAANQVGTAVLTVRATDTGGLTADAALTVNVSPSGAPVVTAAEFLYHLEGPHRVRFSFSQDVVASLDAADLTYRFPGDPPEAPDTPAASVTYDSATNTATFTLTSRAGGILPDGNYQATLAAAGVLNARGVPVRSDSLLEFFVMAGDTNRDRFVNGTDFAILAGNFGRSGMTYEQGDLNGDGAVNGSDFALLAGNFGRSLPAPSATAAPGKANARARGAIYGRLRRPAVALTHARRSIDKDLPGGTVCFH